MEPMVPWLLLVIAGLIVACVLLHSQLRQVESTARGRQSLIADELRDAEAGLLSALERVRHMDQELGAREDRLVSLPFWPAAPPSVALAAPNPHGAGEFAQAGRETEEISSNHVVDGRQERPTILPAPSGEVNAAPVVSRRTPPAPGEWRLRALELARSGASPREIARELELPVGEVELALALES